MKQEQREQISSLLDGAVTQNEIDNILNMLDEDAELRDLWGHYHFIGDVLRGEPIHTDAFHIADLVRQHLEAKSTPSQLIKLPRTYWQRLGFIENLVLVACISIVAIGIKLYLPPHGQVFPDPTTTQTMPNFSMYLDHHEPRWGINQKEIAIKLDRFLVNHQKYSPVALGPKGIIPYATLVDYAPDN